MFNIIKRKIDEKNVKEKNEKEQLSERYHYESLAATADSNADETIQMLSDFVENDQNINIALSGKYGAGKTSIIKTFMKKQKKDRYKPLYISLGMFGINKNNEIKDSNLFCQEIEKSIIQQIVFKEKPQNLPDSNIKRINKLPKRSIAFMGFVILLICIAYIFSIFEVNFGEQIKRFINWIPKIIQLNIAPFFKILIYIGIFIGVATVFTLITLIISKLWRKIVIKSYKIKLPNTELEINENSEESLISKYMNELIYFFSKTNYNLLIIEDLDRFIENDSIKYRILIIFQKLKELSNILNNSKQINRKIRFIYALKDDLFVDATERTKFFDAIVPVIPAMSNFNSYAELKDRFKDEKISDIVIQDISPYIDDYRLIKNITNEYHLFKAELGKNKEKEDYGITDEKVFSIVALKNLRPQLYEELQRDEGEIYELIKNRDLLYKELTRDLEHELEENNAKIKQIQEEKIKSLKELKLIVIGGLYEKNATEYISNSLSVEQFLEDSRTLNYIKENSISIKCKNGYAFSEKHIFKDFDGKENFIARGEKIKNKEDKEIDKIKGMSKQIEKKIKKIQDLSLQEVLEQVDSKKIQNVLETSDTLIEKQIRKLKQLADERDLEKEIESIDDFLKIIQEKTKIDKLALMLVSNGYIDENYKNYMFYFQETEDLREHDYEYIINVRSSVDTEFNYKIYNPQEVIKQLDMKYFGKKQILNFYVLDELLQRHETEKKKEKLNRIIEILLEINEYTKDFVFDFFKHTKNQDLLLQKLNELDNEYINNLILNIEDESKYDRMEYLIKLILQNPKIIENNKAEKYIKEYIEKKTDFNTWIVLNTKVKESLKILNAKFENVEDSEDIKFFDFIYENNLYNINVQMIKLLFVKKGILEQDFEQRNLTIILNNENLKKMKEYIEQEKENYINNCYLKTLGTGDSVESIIECLNNWNISDELKEKVIEHMIQQIEDIRDVNIEYYDSLMENNKVKPTWENYYYFYINKENELSDILVQNIENNIKVVKMQDIRSIKMSEEDEKCFIEFMEEIAKCNKLKKDAYIQIIPLFNIKLTKIEENEIDNEKLNILVINDMIEFNNGNLQILYGQIPETIDMYINNYIQMFINEIEKYTLNKDIVYDIIKSDIIKNNNKNKIIDVIDISYINEKSMEYIINNYSNSKISHINEEIKKQILKSNLNTSYKLLFLEKELNKNDSIDLIEEYINLMPEPYNNIANYEKCSSMFSIPKTKQTEKIVEKLQEKGFKFTKYINKNRINIYNKK